MSPCPSLHVEQSVQLCPVRVCKRTEWRNARERNANFRIVYYQCVYPAGCTKVQNAWIDTHTPTGINICWQSVIEHAQMVLLARLLPVNCSTIFLKKMMLNFRKFSKNSGSRHHRYVYLSCIRHSWFTNNYDVRSLCQRSVHCCSVVDLLPKNIGAGKGGGGLAIRKM